MDDENEALNYQSVRSVSKDLAFYWFFDLRYFYIIFTIRMISFTILWRIRPGYVIVSVVLICMEYRLCVFC